MYSGVFDIAVADPLDRNGLLGAVASCAVRSADTQVATTRLLAWTVEQVQTRHTQADWWCRPDPARRGLLVAIDDAHQVLTDPGAADLAARVAIDGPAVVIGLVAVVESVDLDIVAGRRDLLLALGKTNVFLYDQRQLQLWEGSARGVKATPRSGQPQARCAYGRLKMSCEPIRRQITCRSPGRCSGPNSKVARPSGAQVISHTPAVA
ncbi:MAG: hypothetical protein ACRDTD_18040 [Pseudonocardiaceae bacterium]